MPELEYLREVAEAAEAFILSDECPDMCASAHLMKVAMLLRFWRELYPKEPPK